MMERLLIVKDLSEWLQVSKSTIYQWTHMRTVPHYKLPKGIRFSPEKISRWLKKKEKQTRGKRSNLDF